MFGGVRRQNGKDKGEDGGVKRSAKKLEAAYKL
jgi:hypothetical protein